MYSRAIKRRVLVMKNCESIVPVGAIWTCGHPTIQSLRYSNISSVSESAERSRLLLVRINKT